jgi:uncharacterized protein (TIGR01777 family)
METFPQHLPADPTSTVHPLRIVIPGGSGHVGHILATHFHSEGHDVTVLSRSGATAPWRVVSWDGLTVDDWSSELEDADVLVNLAGRSVNCRYNSRNRRAILDSRVETTRLLSKAIRGLVCPPRLWLNASTATIYRHALDRAMDEATGEIGGREPDSPSSWRFSIDVATRWEESFFSAETPGVRKIALRSAIVMSAEPGGPFDMLSQLVRFGLGGKAGSGKQFVSWIHELDFVRAIEYLIAHEEMEGAVNLAAPGPLENAQFMIILRRAWGTPIGLSAAEWMLEVGAALLRTETELILKSRRVVPGRLLESGFKFLFSDWSAAASDLVKRYRALSRKAKVSQHNLAWDTRLKLPHRGEAK